MPVTEGKEVKGVQIRMGEIKLSLFTDDITDCVRNLKSTLQPKAILIQKLVWCSNIILALLYAHLPQISQFADYEK